jgi:hypothetical protein
MFEKLENDDFALFPSDLERKKKSFFLWFIIKISQKNITQTLI